MTFYFHGFLAAGIAVYLAAGLACITGCGGAANTQSGVGRDIPTLPTSVEQISGAVQARTIHGWHSSRLVMYGGKLYAAATLRDDQARNQWKDAGVIYRREADGKWVSAARLPNQPYHMMVDPRGRFWVVAPSGYGTCEVFRSGPDADLSKWELVYNGTCAYVGGSVSPEGNVLILHAEKNGKGPNAVIAAFYDAAADTWHKSRFETPEERDGYEVIILKGKKALVIVGSSAASPPEQATQPDDVAMSFHGMKWPKAATPWRLVRLAACDDLAQGRWNTRMFINDPWGVTGLGDAYAAPDGKLCLLYSHRGGATRAEYEADKGEYYWARISDDLVAEVQPITVPVHRAKLLVDSDTGRWFLVGGQDNELRLWDLDVSGGGFKLSNERRLADTKNKLTGYVIHTLRPQRFGGQEDKGHFYLMSTGVKSDTQEKENVQLNFVSFEIPRR